MEVIGGTSVLGLRVVDARTLDAGRVDALRPGAEIVTRDGSRQRLPIFYYEVESWADALALTVTGHFGLWEFMDVDVRESAPLRAFPRYVPCAVTMLGAALEVFRLEVGTPVRISANGGHRSPAHARSTVATTHCWGTAADIYRIGSDMLDSQERIEKYGAVARRLLPFASVRPYGRRAGETDDHLHIDIGYGGVVPSRGDDGER